VLVRAVGFAPETTNAHSHTAASVQNWPFSHSAFVGFPDSHTRPLDLGGERVSSVQAFGVGRSHTGCVIRNVGAGRRTKNKRAAGFHSWQKTRIDALRTAMSLSHAVAGRSRVMDDPRLFANYDVGQPTRSRGALNPPSSGHAWKYGLRRRYAVEGPSSVFAGRVWAILMDHTDAAGRTWISLATLMDETGIGSERTARKALRLLVSQGWLRVEPMSWARLRAEQSALGRCVPFRMDPGQAPNLYTLLDGQGGPVGAAARTMGTAAGPGIARTTQDFDQTPLHISRGGPLLHCPGEPPADLHPDLEDPEQRTKTESVEHGARPKQHTHDFVVGQGEEPAFDSKKWAIIVEAHRKQTIAAGLLAPGAPKVRPDDRQTMLDMLEGSLVEVSARIRARVNVTPDADELTQALAEKAMERYFAHKSPYNVAAKWHLKTLHNEFHARLCEAADDVERAYLRAHRNAAPRPEPRKVEPEQLDPEILAEIQKAEAVAQKCYGEQAPVLTAFAMSQHEAEQAPVLQLVEPMAVAAEQAPVLQLVEPMAVAAEQAPVLQLVEPMAVAAEQAPVLQLVEPMAVAAEQAPVLQLVEPMAVAAEQAPKAECTTIPPAVRAWSPYRKASPTKVDELKRIEQKLEAPSKSNKASPAHNDTKDASKAEGAHGRPFAAPLAPLAAPRRPNASRGVPTPEDGPPDGASPPE
jgi:Helix-turn-helix domain